MNPELTRILTSNPLDEAVRHEDEINDLRRELAELYERLDFMERLTVERQQGLSLCEPIAERHLTPV